MKNLKIISILGLLLIVVFIAACGNSAPEQNKNMNTAPTPKPLPSVEKTPTGEERKQTELSSVKSLWKDVSGQKEFIDKVNKGPAITICDQVDRYDDIKTFIATLDDTEYVGYDDLGTSKEEVLQRQDEITRLYVTILQDGLNGKNGLMDCNRGEGGPFFEHRREVAQKLEDVVSTYRYRKLGLLGDNQEETMRSLWIKAYQGDLIDIKSGKLKDVQADDLIEEAKKDHKISKSDLGISDDESNKEGDKDQGDGDKAPPVATPTPANSNSNSNTAGSKPPANSNSNVNTGK